MQKLLGKLRVLRGADGGTVYAEFIMAFTPFFLLFLGTIQLAFIAASGLVVQTAAVKAVRAATVVLDDDPAFYKGEERRLLAFNGTADHDSWVGDVGKQMTQGGSNWPVWSGTSTHVDEIPGVRSKGGPRLRAIRRAAYMPLSAIGPEWGQVAAWFGAGGMLNMLGAQQEARYSLAKTAIGRDPTSRLYTSFLAWNPLAAAVNFPDKPESTTLRNAGASFNGQVRYGLTDTVTVRVTYLYPCGVPIANLLVCRSLLGMTGIGDTVDDIEDMLDNPTMDDLIHVKDRVQDIYNQQRDSLNKAQRTFEELQAGAEYPALQFALLFAQGARFHVLRREASLPIQAAPYCYPTECNLDSDNPNYKE
jgi:hypothetical protein